VKNVTPLFALLVVTSLGLAPSLAAGACDIGGHNESSENFNPGGWVLQPGTPGGGPAVTGTHLLISEVAPRGGGAGALSDSSEYVEIANPTTQLVVLGNHYLSDASNYYTVVNGPVAVAFTSDYVLRFPTFAYLNPGQRAVICVTKQGYFASGNPPPVGALFLEMRDSNLDPSDDMIILSPASVFPVIGGMLTNPSGTNGEWVVLFCWDGTTDLVCDVDYASWGANSSPANSKMDKSGVCIDGPDGDVLAASPRGLVGVPGQALELDAQPRVGGATTTWLGGGRSLPGEGGRLELLFDDRQRGWLDVWGDGRPASAEVRRGLADLTRLLALLLATAKANGT